MSTLDKLKMIDSLSIEGVIITPIGNQSFKVLHLCGCYFIQHGLAGRYIPLELNNPEKYKRISANREFWVELCSNHQKNYNETY